jgi:hypothetical protein
MNAPLGTKDRPWRARISLLSGESSATIPAGTPVVLKASVNGAAVILPSSSAGVTVATPLFAGIAVNTVTPGNAVEIVAGGYVAKAILMVRTRAASTDSFASVAARAVGNLCTIDTVDNCIAYSAAGAASLASPAIVLMESLASVASTVSHTSLTYTAHTTTVKVWVRGLM